jgi:hypothetical protein
MFLISPFVPVVCAAVSRRRLSGFATRFATIGATMDSFSSVHWIIALAALATVIPAAKALSRVGLSPWWAIISIVPIVGWFGLWAFAYARWPKVESVSAGP